MGFVGRHDEKSIVHVEGTKNVSARYSSNDWPLILCLPEIRFVKHLICGISVEYRPPGSIADPFERPMS